MNRAFIKWMLALAVVILIIQTGAFAQGVFARKEQIVYSGDPIDPDAMKLGAWGGGSCEESSQNAYGGSRSIKVTPKDLYSGGRIDFLKPLDLSKSFAEDDGYMQIITKFWGAQVGYDALTVGLGAAGSTDMYGGVYQSRQVRRVRVVLFFEGGQSTEVQMDLSGFKLQEDGWMVVSFPLAALKSKLGLPDYKLERLAIAGDGSEAFHVGEIATIRDSTPIIPGGGESKEVARNYPIAFQAFCRAGATPVKYSWDFDNTDGIQEQATGDLAYHTFTKAGNFQVTLTVSDVFGIKKPATATVEVKVNE
ncbi:MAG TPA: PKD domain-containing protein [Armatimonadota bacterium]|nr:PKD domain-containing protein [Armatimonadota bacterium]